MLVMNISISRYIDVLKRYISHQKFRFGLLSFFVIFSIGLQVVNPQIMKYFIDAATSGKPDAHLTVAAVIFICIAILQQVISVSATYTGEVVAWSATNEMRAELAQHCLDLEMEWHNNRSPGEMIERIESDLFEFSSFFSQLVIRIIGNMLLMLGILIAFTLTNWQLGLGFFVFTIITLIVLYSVRGIAIPYQKAFRDANTELFGYLEERLAGTEDIRSSGAVDYVLRGLYKLQKNILNRWWKAQTYTLGVRATAGLMLTAGLALAFLLGFHLFKSGAITIGVAYLIVHYTGLISRPIRELSMQVESMQNIGATVERMSELLNVNSAIADGPNDKIPGNGALSLEFENVGFGYNEEKQILKNLSLKLGEGKVLGLLGRTGSGKTTLARLIFRLYDSTNGVIRVNGVDIKSLKLHTLRNRVAYVTQDVQLFQASVRDNITFFDSSTPDSKILEVIDALELHDWFNSLPDGLDTRLQTGGRSLSAGEAQLLAFTRVFLRDPGLIVLDEASSRLDPATEFLVQRAVEKLLEGRTSIIIAHRLAAVDKADDILILDENGVLEYGKRLSLIEDQNSHLHKLRQTGMEEILA